MIRVIMIVWAVNALALFVASMLHRDAAMVVGSSISFSIALSGLGIADALRDKKT